MPEHGFIYRSGLGWPTPMLNKLISIWDKIHWVASDSHTLINKVFYFFKSLHNEKVRHWKVLSREISHFHIQCNDY